MWCNVTVTTADCAELCSDLRFIYRCCPALRLYSVGDGRRNKWGGQWKEGRPSQRYSAAHSLAHCPTRSNCRLRRFVPASLHGVGHKTQRSLFCCRNVGDVRCQSRHCAICLLRANVNSGKASKTAVLSVHTHRLTVHTQCAHSPPDSRHPMCTLTAWQSTLSVHIHCLTVHTEHSRQLEASVRRLCKLCQLLSTVQHRSATFLCLGRQTIKRCMYLPVYLATADKSRHMTPFCSVLLLLWGHSDSRSVVSVCSWPTGLLTAYRKAGSSWQLTIP